MESLRDGYEVARLVQAVAGAVTVGLIGVLAGQLWSRWVALVAMAIAAVYVPLILVGGSLMSESLFPLLVGGATVCAIAHRRSAHRFRWAIAAGALTGIAGLLRGNGLF